MQSQINQMTAVMLSHEAIEYGTPQHIADLARECMGGIDLDPASSEIFNRTIRATYFLTQAQNGLRYKWSIANQPSKVWLNPPYSKTAGKSNQEIWAKHLERQYHAGNVDQACLLIRAALGYNWFENLWRLYPTCVLRDRLCFVKPDGSTDGQAKYANAVLYFGRNYRNFIDVFGKFGRILLP